MEFIEKNNVVFSIVKGIFIAFLVTIITLIIFSVILVNTNLSEETIKPVIITITGISILVGSSIGTRKIKKNGIFNGAIIGGIYILSIYIISSIMSSNFSLNLASLMMIIIGMVGGVFGGILGVNSKLKMNGESVFDRLIVRLK